jgi:hypothetical protein
MDNFEALNNVSMFFRDLTLIRMAEGVRYMIPKTLNRHSSKWPEVKIFFHLDLFLTKCFRIISC